MIRKRVKLKTYCKGYGNEADRHDGDGHRKEDILGVGPALRHPTDPQRLHTECKKSKTTPGMPNRTFSTGS